MSICKIVTVALRFHSIYHPHPPPPPTLRVGSVCSRRLRSPPQYTSDMNEVLDLTDITDKIRQAVY